MPFETDADDTLLAKAGELRQAFHLNAVERDKQGGRPVDQIRLLKQSGLPSAQIAREYGGQGASWLTILRIVREFAKTDGSLAHLFGYHHLPLNLILFRGSAAQKEKWLTGSGTVRFVNLEVHDDELISSPDVPLTPWSSLTSLLQQSVLLNVFVGSAQGILEEGRNYTTTSSRPWIYSGVERHVDDPWIKRQYGDLYIRTLAAAELADKAARSLDAAYAEGPSLTAVDRGAAAINIATANVYAGEVGLAVSSEVFEVMGARSATTANGFDRFWRNVRTHTLHNPAEYKKRTVGTWLLTGEFPVPAIYR
ncbi:monooxygenase [Rhizobium sp. AC44/96]|uniref:acyl-CoA dehydrogenase family protein n=1 Tax=Rhizobium sp. AC44/96 TaxID=1841654 RepID=UPI00080FFE43|nr:acyl-CoA dehydrogenase family protein [Rhizobium sp. AC44/96]OCJ16388.1 monooxygenase [Rhizobium sp. AC44/96]